ncbi:MAG TPA: C-GCAxxG-C-C family protein [Rectinemataceae bacterium]
MTRAEKAVALHNAGSACSQAVFAVFARDLGIDYALAHRLACGFGGGVGRRGMICGAVSGGVLVLSVLYGSTRSEDQEAKLKTYDAVAKFLDAMEKSKGSLQCRTLLGGLDLWKEADRDEMKAKGLSDSVCNSLIADVVAYIEDILPPEM